MSYDYYGAQVDLVSTTSLAISAPGYSHYATDAGAVYIYSKVNQDVNVMNSSVTSEEWMIRQIITPSYHPTESNFGYIMSFYDQYALISAYTETHSSIVYVYQLINEVYTMTQLLYPADGSNSHLSAFGSSLCLCSSTISIANISGIDSQLTNITYTLAIIGSPGDSSGDIAQAGAVYFYITHPFAITSQGYSKWTLIAKLTGNDSLEYSSYGSSVACAAGNVFVGATLANTPIAQQAGAVYVEHDLINYLTIESEDLISSNSQTTSSSRDSFWMQLKSFLTSSGGLVGMACLPAAVFIILVLFQARRDKNSWSLTQSYAVVHGQKSDPSSSSGWTLNLFGKPRNSSSGGKSTLNDSVLHVESVQMDPQAAQDAIRSPTQLLTTADIYDNPAPATTQPLPVKIPGEHLFNRRMRSFRQLLSSYTSVGMYEEEGKELMTPGQQEPLTNEKAQSSHGVAGRV
jgi:hypothetical protein